VSEESVKDPLALGLGSLASGIGFGGACLTAAQIVASILRGDLDPRAYHDTVPDPLIIGIGVAFAVGFVGAWYRSAALENIWQRGVIAVLAAVGAILSGFLAAPLDRFLGLIGLFVWLLLNIACGIVAMRWAVKGKGVEGS
jgi:CHASE2 domain-containing sensor protein